MIRLISFLSAEYREESKDHMVSKAEGSAKWMLIIYSDTAIGSRQQSLNKE